MASRPEDAEYHPRDPQIANWAETIGFWFGIPEEQIMGRIYILSRPNVGAMTTAVLVSQGMNASPLTIDLNDAQMHVPAPASLAHFISDSGVTVESTNAPTDYRFGYKGIAGTCSFDLTLTGAMPAWDPSDPDENPLLKVDERHNDLGLGDAWSHGHLDFLGRVEGTLQLRGKEYQFSAMGGMDRSWGPRTEIGQRAISYIHLPFGEDFGVHLVIGVSVDDGATNYGPFRFGYIHEGTSVYGIVDAKVTSRTKDYIPYEATIEITDERGKTFHFTGKAIAAAPWYQFIPAYVAFLVYMDFEYEGRHAYGLFDDIYGLEWLGEHISRHGTQPHFSDEL